MGQLKLELHKENKDTLFEGIHRISFLSYYSSDKVNLPSFLYLLLILLVSVE